MGRQSKLKKMRKADPARAARIAATRKSDRELHDVLERALRLTRELIDRMHYDEISKQTASRAHQLIDEIVASLRKRVEILGQCVLANHEIERECETLRDQLDRLEGRPPRPDPLEDIEPLIEGLPADQANGLRLVVALSRLPAPPAPETSEDFDKASAFVNRFDATVAALRSEAGFLIEAAEKRVQRGWADRAEIERHKTAMAGFLSQIEAAVPHSRQTVASWLTDYQALRHRRQELRDTIAQHPPSSR